MALSVPTRINLANILVATDFSCCSEAVLPYARSLAQQYNSTLYLAHVISPELLAVDPAVLDTAHVQAERLMEDLRMSGQLEGVRYKRILEEGETWEALNRLIEQEHIALVIVGTHGRTGIRKLMLGSVAESIFRRSPCPVLTIGPRVVAETKREATLRHILYATNLNPEHAATAVYAAALAHDHGAQLTLLHVVEGPQTPEKQELLKLVPYDVELPNPPEPLVETGDPADVILGTAAARHVDLIVLGARPSAKVSHFRDTPYSVMCEALCPVLTVRADYQNIG